MQLSFSIILLSLLLPASVYCAPTGTPEPSTSKTHSTTAGGASSKKIHKCDPGKGGNAGYIVALQKGVKVEGSDAMKLIPPGVKVTHLTIINGFHADLDEATLTKLSALADIRTISENCLQEFTAMKTQDNAPWGLSRLTSKAKLTGSATSLTHQYTHDEHAGACADIYIVDSGVNVDHVDFGGRATHGKSFGKYPAGKENVDETGHGTHCAGIAAGLTYGVAKAAHIISVKVGEYPYSTDIIQAFTWIADQVDTKRRPSVVSYSMSAHEDFGIDFAAEFLVDGGIHFVAAAGNQNKDVATRSPGHLPQVITVGATNINDHRRTSSNFGALVDVFAPGEDIMSTWIGSTTATHVLSGTSMATPHVAGMVATMLCHDTSKVITPADMQKMITTNAIQGIIQGIPAGTPNRLAHLPGQTGQQAHSTVAQTSQGRKTPPPPEQKPLLPKTPSPPRPASAGPGTTQQGH